MYSVSTILYVIIIIGSCGWIQGAESEAGTELVRETRTLHKKRLCRKYGICEGQGGYGGYGGYQGHQGYGGYGGYPINIAISQSQSSANEGGGGYSSGYYPNNHQYNGYPNQGYGGYNQGHGYNHGYGYNKPYYGNGQGSYNNQFNGNYYGGNGPKPYGYSDEDGYDGEDYAYERSSGLASAGAYAEAGGKSN